MQNLRAAAPPGTRCFAGGGGLVIAGRPGRPVVRVVTPAAIGTFGTGGAA
jgi:hypothetical protein